MTFKYTDLGPGDLGCEHFQKAENSVAESESRLEKVWGYLVDHSTNTDAAILDLLNGANISHIPWTPIMHELADAVNYVLSTD